MNQWVCAKKVTYIRILWNHLSTWLTFFLFIMGMARLYRTACKFSKQFNLFIKYSSVQTIQLNDTMDST